MLNKEKRKQQQDKWLYSNTEMCVIADDFYEADDSLQLQGNVASDVRTVDVTANISADVGDQTVRDSVEAASVERNSVLQVDSTDLVNTDSDTHCQPSSDLSVVDVQCLSKDGVSGDEFISNGILQPIDSASAEDSVKPQPQDSTDNDMPAVIGDTQSGSKEAVVSHDVSGVEEAVDSDFLQPSGSELANDVNQLQQLDKAVSENGQQTSCASLPLLVADEASTADSNDDFAEFVEASTSLNPDSAGELCASTLPVTCVETQQSETGTDAERQPDEDGDVDNKDEEQCIDSLSGVSPPQSEDKFAGDSPSEPADSTSAADNAQSQQRDSANDMPADSSDTQLEGKEAVVSDDVSRVEGSANSDFLQLSGSQLANGANQLEKLDKVASENGQQTSSTSLPVIVPDEPSMADSNDDFAEFVEASTSLNPDSSGELCVVTLPVTCVETEQSETGTDAGQQPDEDGDADNKDEELFVDSSSDIAPPQPTEGKCWQFAVT